MWVNHAAPFRRGFLPPLTARKWVAGLPCRHQQRRTALVALPFDHTSSGVTVWQAHLTENRMLKTESLIVLLLNERRRLNKAILHTRKRFWVIRHSFLFS